MTKQLLIYGEVTPVNKKNHADLCIQAINRYDFASDVNSVPVTAVEFPNAASVYPLVFAGQGDAITPIAIMGIRDGENLFISEDGSIDAGYVPAYLRRYPFVFSTSNEGKNFVLCVDEEAKACNTEGKGERLFDSTGEQTAYVNNVLKFLKEYQAHFTRTKVFCQKLKDLDLLQPMGAQFTHPEGQKFTLTGFQVINREKLQQLAAEDLAALSKTGELELAYCHLQSLHHLNGLVARVVLDDSEAESSNVKAKKVKNEAADELDATEVH